MLNDELASLASCLQQQDTPLIKTEDGGTDHLMSGDTFGNALNNQQSLHDINQQQMQSQQVNLNAPSRMTPTPTDSACGNIQQQPLPSNVMSKQSGGGNNGSSMEYMQTQNHIFVFSTALANKGAEAVLNGLHTSIVAYHCAQPGTKKFLEVSF